MSLYRQTRHAPGVIGLAHTARMLVTPLVAAFILPASAFGHGGGKDKNGCHFDKKVGKRHCHDKSGKAKRWSACDGKIPVPGEEDVLFGRVVSVTDGDTFKAKIQGTAMVFRMADIDAPEMDQSYGHEAREALKAALGGKDVVMLRVDTDSRGRFVVHVWIANLHINREVVAEARRGSTRIRSRQLPVRSRGTKPVMPSEVCGSRRPRNESNPGSGESRNATPAMLISRRRRHPNRQRDDTDFFHLIDSPVSKPVPSPRASIPPQLLLRPA